MKVAQQISNILLKKFPDATLEIINESHKHQRHAHSPGTGESHFSVIIVSQKFQDLSRVTRHRLVYEALSDLLPHPIHALKLTTATPVEYEKTH